MRKEQSERERALITLSEYPELLSVDEVAAILRITPAAARKRIERRQFDVTRVGYNVRVPREALRHYLLDRLVPAKDAT
jgi:excisionase family DNA binding protein